MKKIKQLRYGNITTRDYSEPLETDFDDEGKITLKTTYANYALIDEGDGVRCAWCNKLSSKIKDIDKHLSKHKKEDNGK